MSDTVKYTVPATGVPISTEELTVKGVLQHLQRVKIGIGPSGVYQNDLSFGAATIANSLPVNIASDQQVPTQNYAWDSQSGAWSKIISSSVAPTPTGVELGIVTRLAGGSATRLGGKATYMASSNGTVTMSTTAATTTSIAYLWHPSSNAKRVSLQKMLLTFTGIGTGNFNISVARITAENGTPGGTSQTINPQDGNDVASACTFRTGAAAPTRSTGDYVTMTFNAATDGYVDLVDILEGKGFICRASTAEGWEVKTVPGSLSLSASPYFGVTFVWNEE